MVSALQKSGKYIFLEEQESSALGPTWRAAELAGGKIDKNLLADVVTPDLADDSGFRRQYLSQSQLSVKLEHPNILRKIATLEMGNELIGLHEFQEGFSLEKVMTRCQNEMNPFSVDHALLVVSKLLSALAYAKTRHLTHGFVNPSKIFVTHEGEIKLKGFAFSSALRGAATVPDLGAYFKNYVPEGTSIADDDRDRLDIYGCGAILYEMLVGEPFSGSDVAVKLKGAHTAIDGDPIPPKIAAIILNALDPNQPGSYKDIQKMAKDMDELLFSGEYSPTTFNLAFFMHSAFRQEMETLGEKVAAEREKNYDAATEAAPAPSKKAVAAPPPQPAAAAPPPRPPVTPKPAVAEQPAKSKMPMILGGVVAVLLIAIVAVIALRPSEDGDGDRFAAMEQQLAEEGESAEAARQRQEMEELRRQNEQLQLILEQQARLEREREEQELADQMAQVDQQIAEIRRREEQAKLAAKMKSELDALQQARQDLESKQKEAEERRKREEAARQAKAKEEVAKAKTEGTDADQAETVADDSSDSEGASTVEASSNEPDNSSGPVSPPETRPGVSSRVPPKKGQLVDLSDEFLKRPRYEERVPTMDVPRRAIKDGVVKRDTKIYFMVKALVNEDGKVEDVELWRNPLRPGAPDYGMIEKAERVVRKLKFTEPTKLGVPVKVWIYVPVYFVSR